MTRPRATEQLHVRIPRAEKQALLEEARSYGISMSALVRINSRSAREQRERGALLGKIYPCPIAMLGVQPQG